MHVLRTIRWAVHAWISEVHPATIQNCFRHSQTRYEYSSTRVKPSLWKNGHDTLNLVAEKARDLRIAGRIRDAMQISNFISPPEEDVDDDEGDIIGQIAAQYDPERPAESDEEEDHQPSITVREAVQALEKLQLYEMQQADGDPVDVQRLNVWRQRIQHRHFSRLQQTSLDSYFCT